MVTGMVAGRPERLETGRANGFTLVEVLVACAVLMVGALGAVTTLALAARLLHEARTRERAAYAATLVLDSLLHAPLPLTSGERRIDHFHARWQPRPGETGTVVEVVIEDRARGGPLVVFGGLREGPAGRALEATEAP
jgi:Tfp pilus assembly protein PilV